MCKVPFEFNLLFSISCACLCEAIVVLSIKIFESLTLFLLCPSILSSAPGSEEVQTLLTVIETNEVGAISQSFLSSIN